MFLDFKEAEVLVADISYCANYAIEIIPKTFEGNPSNRCETPIDATPLSVLKILDNFVELLFEEL